MVQAVVVQMTAIGWLHLLTSLEQAERPCAPVCRAVQRIVKRHIQACRFSCRRIQFQIQPSEEPQSKHQYTGFKPR